MFGIDDILLGTQLGLGGLQALRGIKGAKVNKSPIYSMPKEYEQNLSDAQMRAAGGLPSASKQLATEQMARGTAAGLTKLNDRNMVAAGVAGLAQGEADQANKLAVMDAQARMSGQRDVAAARLAIAGAKDKDFAIKQQDYLRKAQANANLIDSGVKNVIGGLQTRSMMDMLKGVNEDSSEGKNGLFGGLFQHLLAKMRPDMGLSSSIGASSIDNPQAFGLSNLILR
jgi:hypothetical protein